MSVEEINLITEQINQKSQGIDQMDVINVLTCINEEDKKIADAVEKVLPSIARAVELIVTSIKNGGRLMYIGAGTSGRLGVLDASECPPTFNTHPELVKGIIAGGETALRNAVEGVEDLEEQGLEDLKKENLNQNDVVVGIAASGQTPYVIGGLKYAQRIGAKTISLACNPESMIGEHADVAIEVIVGPEILSGSTRLKSGTAQKMVLNMLSTASMIQLGKIYNNLMVDLQASNHKLKTRAIRIITLLTDSNEDQAKTLLEQSDWNVKEALVMFKANIDRRKAQEYLEISEGRAALAIEKAKKDQ
jgi:N-acetylmuramic acid 6-phosphate etherase